MENPQEFLDRNLEELKALQIGEIKVIDGVRLKGDIDCRDIDVYCADKGYDFAFVEVDENDNLENEMELNV